MSVEPQKLKEVLELLINSMVRKGLLPEKPGLAAEVTEKLTNIKGLELNNLDHPDTLKALGMACMAQANPANKFDYTLLFKSQKALDALTPTIVAEQLKNLFTDMLALKLKFGHDKQLEKALDKNLVLKQLNNIASKISEKLFDKKQNDSFLNLCAGCLDAANDLRFQFYGGSEDRVVSQFVGNLIGAVDLTAEKGAFFMNFNDDPATPDPLAMKTLEVINDIVSNPANPKDTLLEVLMESLSPNKSPQLKPPGFNIPGSSS